MVNNRVWAKRIRRFDIIIIIIWEMFLSKGIKERKNTVTTFSISSEESGAQVASYLGVDKDCRKGAKRQRPDPYRTYPLTFFYEIASSLMIFMRH